MKRYEIWYARLPKPNEETYMTYGDRPVVVLSNDVNNTFGNTVTVVPFTSNLNKRAMPTHVYVQGQGLPSPSIAMCEQIVTMDKSRLDRQIGVIEKEWDKLCIDHAVQVQLGLAAQ